MVKSAARSARSALLGTQRPSAKRGRWVTHMYYGIGLGGLIVLVVILLFLF